MRLLVCCIMVVAATAVRAEDEPKGFIGIQVKIDEGKIIVVEPIKDSPAAKAGIKAGDILLKVNDVKIKDKVEEEDLAATIKEIGKHEAGKKLKLTVKRADKEMVIEVTPGKRSDIVKD